jgi:hypothetical protein
VTKKPRGRGGHSPRWAAEPEMMMMIIIIIIIIEAAYKTEIINIAEYLNTKYKGDQFVNVVKNHVSTQPNMNSIFKLAAKITEDVNKLNEKNDAKQDEIQHTKAKLGEVLKENW